MTELDLIHKLYKVVLYILQLQIKQMILRGALQSDYEIASTVEASLKSTIESLNRYVEQQQ